MPLNLHCSKQKKRQKKKKKRQKKKRCEEERRKWVEMFGEQPADEARLWRGSNAGN